jgi:hypothetical protein
MKIIIKQFALFFAFMGSINLAAYSQSVTPTTTGVKLFCNSGVLDLGAPPASTTWEVAYSNTPTTTPSTGITLTSNTIAGTELRTGYYYVMTKGTAPGSCISEATQVPVFLLSPLAVDFTGYELCAENVSGTTPLTGTVTSTDTDNTYTYAYQWYTVSGGVESPISGATDLTYTPTLTTASTTTYRLKAGYLIGTGKYCSSTADHNINIIAAPGAPSITISSSSESW